MMSGMTVDERNQPQAGGSKKIKKPFGRARTSCGRPPSSVSMGLPLGGEEYSKGSPTDLKQDKLVEQDASPHICKGNSPHDDQSADHEALRPSFKSQFAGE